MAPSVSLAIASRAENLLMADIAIRLTRTSSRSILFCELPCNAKRRSNAICSLIRSMTWGEVHASPTIKYSTLPAWMRRLGGRLLDRSIRTLAITCSLVHVVAYGLSHGGTSVDLVCGRPRLALLVLCHLLRPKTIIFLDTGPKVDAFEHLTKAYTQFQGILRLVSLSGWRSGSLAGYLRSLSERPIPLLCWSVERYEGPQLLSGTVQPMSVDQLTADSGGPPLYGSAEGSPYVFLIGKPTLTPRDDLLALIAAWCSTCPEATPVYFLHPREQADAAHEIMAAHHIPIADRSLCIESHVMTTFKNVALRQVISIRDSRSIQTLRLLYGDRFTVRLIR